jgi:hypothetical protein
MGKGRPKGAVEARPRVIGSDWEELVHQALHDRQKDG